MKSILVTGAASGIGAGIAHELARAGLHLIVSDVKLDDVQPVARQIRDQGGSSEAVGLDVTSDDSVVINTNLNSVFEITRRFIDPMAARGWGRVINISSIVGRIGNFGQANYAAAKAGLIGLTKSLAREYASKGVTVNAIAPGFVKTRMLDGVPDKVMQAVIDLTSLAR